MAKSKSNMPPKDERDQIAEQFVKDSTRLALHLKMVVTLKIVELLRTMDRDPKKSYTLSNMDISILEQLIEDYYQRFGPVGLMDILGYIQQAPKINYPVGQRIFDIYHDLKLERLGQPRTDGYREYIEVVRYHCSKCKDDKLQRDIIFRIPRSECDQCPDWNLCSDCFEEMEPDTQRAVKRNPKIIPWKEW